VVEKFQHENQGRDKRICIAGHSLGIAIALIVGGLLYSTHNIHIDTHLFNPPLLTVVNVLVGRARIPTPQTKDAPCLEVDFSLLKEALVGNQAAMLNEWEQLGKLQGFVPSFYLNPSNPICSHYIPF
jgi:hypothetical protein